MQIFFRYFLEQRLSQYRGVFAGKLISERTRLTRTRHPRETPAHTSRCHITRGEFSLIRAVNVCATPKGMGFQPFWSKISGIDFGHFGLK